MTFAPLKGFSLYNKNVKNTGRWQKTFLLNKVINLYENIDYANLIKHVLGIYALSSHMKLPLMMKQNTINNGIYFSTFI